MDDEPIEELERQLTATPTPLAPVGLRAAVLHDVHRELRAARWDRRLARAAVVLLVVGVGLNAAMVLPRHAPSSQILTTKPTHESLVLVGISVAEATDVPTGKRFARQLAAITGRRLSRVDAAALDAAVERRTSRGPLIGKEG